MFLEQIKNNLAYLLLGCSVSLSTFAESEKIDTSQIVGKWQCNERLDYMGYDAQTSMESMFTETGKYSDTSKIILKNEIEVANFKASSTAQWNINGSVLSIEHNHLDSFETDNESLNKKLNIKTSLADPDVLEFVIKKLTPNDMVLNLVLFDTEIENLSRRCTR